MASAAAARGMLQRSVRGRQALFGGPRPPEAQPGQPTVMAASPFPSAAARESPASEPQLQGDSESADDEPELQSSSDDEGVTEPELLRSPLSSEDGALSEHDSPTVRAASAAASAHRQARREAEEDVQQVHCAAYRFDKHLPRSAGTKGCARARRSCATAPCRCEQAYA
jgi:hypothetical protein